MTDEEIALLRRINQLEEGLKNFSIIASDPNLDIQGSFATGFAVNCVNRTAPVAALLSTTAPQVTYNDSGTPEMINVDFNSDWVAI